MRDEYLDKARRRRVKQLKRGNRPLVESLEKLSPEDTALREIIEGKISHELAQN